MERVVCCWWKRMTPLSLCLSLSLSLSSFTLPVPLSLSLSFPLCTFAFYLPTVHHSHMWSPFKLVVNTKHFSPFLLFLFFIFLFFYFFIFSPLLFSSGSLAVLSPFLFFTSGYLLPRLPHNIERETKRCIDTRKREKER